MGRMDNYFGCMFPRNSSPNIVAHPRLEFCNYAMTPNKYLWNLQSRECSTKGKILRVLLQYG